MAAQAGVRYSIEKPRVYLDSNIIGTYNIIETSHKFKVKHLIIASSSSVYGANKKFPFKEREYGGAWDTVRRADGSVVRP